MKANAPTEQERQAAREWLEHDYARHRLSGEPAHVAHENATQLEQEHPRARDIALTGTEQELGELPAHLRRHQVRRRRATGMDQRQVERIRSSYRQAAPAPRRNRTPSYSPPPRRSAPQQVASSAGDVIGWAGDTGWGSLFLQMVVWGMGLSVAYLLLTHDTAVSKLALGATNTARAVVSPHIDPLNPGRSL